MADNEPAIKPRSHLQEMMFARLESAVRIVESFNALLANQKPNHTGRSDGLDDDQGDLYYAAMKTVKGFM